MEDKPLLILEAVIQRLCLDLKIEGSGSTGIILLKCFNIVRTFVEQNNYIMTFYPQIEKIIYPLYENLNRNNMEFVEDIFAIILGQILKKKSIPSSMETLFPYFQNIFERRKGVLGTLFQILNGYLQYGDSVFLNNGNNIDFVNFSFLLFMKLIISFFSCFRILMTNFTF